MVCPVSGPDLPDLGHQCGPILDTGPRTVILGVDELLALGPRQIARCALVPVVALADLQADRALPPSICYVIRHDDAEGQQGHIYNSGGFGINIVGGMTTLLDSTVKCNTPFGDITGPYTQKHSTIGGCT